MNLSFWNRTLFLFVILFVFRIEGNLAHSGNKLSNALDFDISRATIYGYGGKFIIAEVDNAINDHSAYTGFEEGSTGNWTINANGVQYIQGKKSITGKQFYSLSVGNITKSFAAAPNKNFLISYWSKSGPQSVNGGAPTQTGRSVTIDGFTWTLYTHGINNPASITISGTGNIDDVRLHPDDAKMVSYTYDPMFGKTSVSDINLIIAYYEYDDLGRLFIVRDYGGNILKKYCYNYSGQTEACGFFASAAQSGNFTRNNCGTGGMGSSVSYSVPLGAYTSNISQADANQKAINALNIDGQTNANTVGTCTYYSDEKSGSFTRNNCGAGYTGSTVTYTIAANAYSSIVSKAAANQLAVDAVNAGGQTYANTNGTCSPQLIYATITYSGFYNDGIFTTATVEIKFYSNAALTNPVSVNNLTVNYKKEKTTCSSITTTTNFSVTGSGTSISLGSQIIDADDGGTKCYYQDFYITAGTGYIAS